jgi:hypothetical protein
MEEPAGLREAVERNAEAVMAGNFSQLMADITPEALAQMMQMAPQGGQVSLAQMPNITGYAIEPIGPDGDGFVYNVTFTSSIGRATAAATWKQLMGQWKITGISVVSLEPGTPE